MDLSVNPFREGLTESRVADPCAFVIFGATGDLTHRKLIPALFSLYLESLLPSNFAIVGFARRDWSDERFRDEMWQGIQAHARRLAGEREAWEGFARSLFYNRSTFQDPEGYDRLKTKLSELDKSHDTHGNRLFYLATPPSDYEPIIEQIGAHNLQSEERGWARIIVEKPIGTDLASSRELNSAIRSVFPESRIYRIDHFLGKETVQNILVFRFANSIFEPIWNQKYVDHVQITNAENIGLEGRGAFFDKAGIVRDLAQNHQLQLLTLMAMEPPSSLRADAIRDEKLKVLQAVRLLTREEVDEHAVRGQYTAGLVQGQPALGYLEEPNVQPDSATETYAAVRLFVDNWRWAGVPFYLRVGKRLPKKSTEISLQFKEIPNILFGATQKDAVRPDLLVIRIQPDEGIFLRFTSKEPGPSMRLQQVRMGFQYGASFGTPSPEAYERLLLDAASGEQALFARDDEVEAQWRIVMPVLDRWRELGRQGLHEYQAGTWGPLEAFSLLTRDGRRWRRI
ncbi:MAG: glucose-6-phosphate dehydrogenase [Armatimonadetes bacterium]|nr:glucose-6-phosphate dehydrogenase [Armatimonadota bacterium]